MSFYVEWKERSPNEIKNKRINCINEQDVNNKLMILKKLRYIFDVEKKGGNSIEK